nr:hypothetical protein [Lachnospiraceae bacterium]
MKKFLKVIGIILIVLLAVFIGAAIISHFTNKTAKIKSPSELSAKDFPKTTVPSDMQVMYDEQLDAYLDTLKAEPSDIDGWSKYDKYIHGFGIEDGSDKDCDGLTDQEEIEIYGSDPMKCSSAGDLYTDGEKIEAEMDPYTYLEAPDNEKEYRVGAFTIYRSTPWDYDTVVIDMTEEYTSPDASLLARLPEQFYFAYEVCQFDGTQIDVDLSEFAEYLGIGADKLDVEAHALHNNPYKKKRSGDVITVTFQDVESFDSGIGMKGYDIFIVNKKTLTDRIPFLSGIKQWFEQNIAGKLEHQNTFGIVKINTFYLRFMNSSPSTVFGKTIAETARNSTIEDQVWLFCPEDATSEEIQYTLYAGEYLYYLTYGEPVQLSKDFILFQPREDFENHAGFKGGHKWDALIGIPLNLI